MFKNQISPLTKHGKVQVHQGKGSRVSKLQTQGNNPAPAGGAAPPPNVAPNNYAKQATPPAAPSAPDGGLGSGNWPGIGM